jgi:hypothetical protein
MQPHEGPREPKKPEMDPKTWWLVVFVAVLLGLITGQVINRWLL